MELKKVVGANVTHIAEARYKNFDGVNLNNDTVYRSAKKRTAEDIKREMTIGYMKLLSK